MSPIPSKGKGKRPLKGKGPLKGRGASALSPCSESYMDDSDSCSDPSDSCSDRSISPAVGRGRGGRGKSRGRGRGQVKAKKAKVVGRDRGPREGQGSGKMLRKKLPAKGHQHETNLRCRTCDVALCIRPDRNCFEVWHSVVDYSL